MKSSKIIFFIAVVFCVLPIVDTPFALLAGIIIAQTFQNPYKAINKKLTCLFLQSSVVGLGFGMNAFQAVEAGRQGIYLTIFSILSTMLLGFIIGKSLGIERKTSYLISTGTSICGGSAIAAISKVVKSNEKQVTTALSTIFILNSLALFLFPWIGKMIHMSQQQFGMWVAIAIHDTSSVVGAASRYGAESLQTATTIKLERALWIIPVALISIPIFKSESKKIQIPYFIVLFIAAMLINTFIPGIKPETAFIVMLSKIGLKITLFLIGTGMTRELFLSLGSKPFLQGVLLWIFISVLSFIVITHI